MVTMIVMTVMFISRLEMRSTLAEKHQPYLTAHVKGCQHGREKPKYRNQIVNAAAFNFRKSECTGQDGVLAHKTACKRQAGKGKRRNSKGYKGPWHFFAQPAHPAHILFVMHGMNDGT